jgi:hypothetical protein
VGVDVDVALRPKGRIAECVVDELFLATGSSRAEKNAAQAIGTAESEMTM